MLTAACLLLTIVQDPAPGLHLWDFGELFRTATVVLPTRRPAYEHLDEVFELPPRIEPEPVTLTHGWSFPTAQGAIGEPSQLSVAVPDDALGLVFVKGRPVDFEAGGGPAEIHLDQIEALGFGIHTFLQPAVALGERVVVDLPWSRQSSGSTTYLVAAYSGRVVNAGGGPVPGLELQLARRGRSRGPSQLAELATTGPDGKWEREPVRASGCWTSPPPPPPEPVKDLIALRTHGSHAWQVFPYSDGGTILLPEPSLLSVFVVDELGQPVDGSDLRLGPATLAAPGLLDLPGPVAPDSNVTLRDLGGWEVPGLPRGVYRVYARAPGHAPAAASIDLSSGHRELMLTLPRAEPFSVSVLDADGAPATGARVTVSTAGADVPIDGETANANGKLVIDRAPATGPFLLRAEHPRLGSAEITWEAGAREVTLTLSGAPPPPRTSGTWGALYDRLHAE